MNIQNINSIWYHKNFNMVKELDVSGEFIYNGIHALNQSDSTGESSGLFSALYNIAVGIERIQKIILTLAEEITFDNYEEFEKQLITHSHTGLHAKINRVIQVNMNERENDLLLLLQTFYNTGRYNRFNLISSYESESEAVSKYILKHIDDSKIVKSVSSNDVIMFTDSVKELFGRVIGSISKKYYSMVKELSSKHNTYTYELRPDSKAEKVFLNTYNKNSLYSQKIDERIAFTEFLIYLANNKDFSPVMRYIKTILPLEIDPAFIQEFVDELSKGNIPQQLVDEVEHHYTENEYSKDRIEQVKAISNTYVHFDVAVVWECTDTIREFVEKNITISEFIQKYKEISNYIDYDDFDLVDTFLELDKLCDEYALNSKSNEEAMLSCANKLLVYLNSNYNN